jgi:hypothetical protein
MRGHEGDELAGDYLESLKGEELSFLHKTTYPWKVCLPTSLRGDRPKS